MKQSKLVSIFTLMAGLSLGALSYHVLSAQPDSSAKRPPLKVTLVSKSDLVDMPGQEAIVQLVEFAPRGATGKHIHPGHEVMYVLEGSGVKEAEGEGLTHLKAGASTYIPAGKVHETRNDSATAPLKVYHHEKPDETLLPGVVIAFTHQSRARRDLLHADKGSLPKGR